jgi:hypothetical protein
MSSHQAFLITLKRINCTRAQSVSSLPAADIAAKNNFTFACAQSSLIKLDHAMHMLT